MVDNQEKKHFVIRFFSHYEDSYADAVEKGQYVFGTAILQ